MCIILDSLNVNDEGLLCPSIKGLQHNYMLISYYDVSRFLLLTFGAALEIGVFSSR
jgi:hypothetical protein